MVERGAPGNSQLAASWAIVPVAGRGRRLEPATSVVPKALLPVGLVPMLHWTLDEALDAGFGRILLVVGPEQDIVRRYVDEAVSGSSSGRDGALERLGGRLRQTELRWIEQPEPRGLGDALARCETVTANEPFVVLLPDNWFAAPDPAIAQVAAGMAATASSALGLTVVSAADARLYGPVGGVRLDPLLPDTYRILDLQDKGDGSFQPSTTDSELRGCGRYALTPEFYDALRATAPGGEGDSAHGEWDDVPAFQWLIARARLVGRRIQGRHFDVGQPPGYAAANVFAHSGLG